MGRFVTARATSSSTIVVTPGGSISSTTVQDAIAELDNEKASKTGVETLENKTLKDPVINLNNSSGAEGEVLVSQGQGLPPRWSSQQIDLATIHASALYF